ncbi:MAG: hypothetical protein IJ367_02640, partial [Clostridia bacterium]|nr:hypothetical protein [Clostridia bacterium]
MHLKNFSGKGNHIMKFQCLKEVLLENLSTVLKAVSPKAAVPQLEGVYVQASDDMI